MAPPSLLRSTLRALLQPRRLIPILVVAVPLVIAQGRFSRDPLAVPLGIIMCLAFFLLAPVSWRALFPAGESRTRTFAAPFGRVIVYTIAGAGTVLTLGSFIPNLLGMQMTMMTSDVSLLVSLALFWVGGYGLGRDIDLERSLAHARARADTMALEAERAQLLALRTHLDPHFLFNTLNAIAEWCREDGETAERATLELSAMLRVVLEASRKPSWPLAQELALCQTLLDLHLIRDPELFQLRREFDDSLPGLEVPPMILLPLCENAIKHGPASGHRGDLILRARVEGHSFIFEVDNPGRYDGPRPGGEGLKLIRMRLDHAYGGEADFDIAGDDNRTTARVTIPVRYEKPRANA